MRRSAPLAVLLLLTLTACDPGTPGTPGTPPGAGEPLTRPQQQLLARAEQTLIARCLTARGFRYEVRVPQSPPPRRFPYVVDDVGWARAHGFGRDEERRLAAAKAADPNERYFRTLPPARQRAALAALNGPRPVGLRARMPGGGTVAASDEGCTAQAQRRLYGDLPAWFEARLTAANLTPLYVPRVRADPAYRTAVRDWSACMTRRGHAYPTPEALRAALPGTGERELAVAEAECAADSGLAATAKALDARYGAAARRAHAAPLATKARLERAALPRAREVLTNRP
ncbi:hypothetical protein ACGFMM_28975 [Streptomyces sp. NPDC048604]|uniref:hypothetical protein n=1 Tax=Streptomyces sp. NPDC048604 TaxID=3365578 RepID=UPI00371F9991